LAGGVAPTPSAILKAYAQGHRVIIGARWCFDLSVQNSGSPGSSLRYCHGMSGRRLRFVCRDLMLVFALYEMPLQSIYLKLCNGKFFRIMIGSPIL
jgi:hypothetical protein